MKDTVIIDRRVLEILAHQGNFVTRQDYVDAATSMAKEALEAQPTDDEIMREAAMRHINRMLPESDRSLFVRICPNKERNCDGLLEWLLCYEFEHGGKLTVGLIQRQPGGEVEAHS